MMKIVTLGAALTGLAMISAAPASAQVARFDPALKQAPLSAEQAQWRGRGGWRGGGYRGGYRGGYYRRGVGPGIIGGLAAGALIGGAIASQAAPVYGAPYLEGDPDGYCMQRFKSYDPASGTYLGYDGLRHPCP
jgi:hypothetical protein